MPGRSPALPGPKPITSLISTISPMATRQKILILDDEQDLLEIYQEILARLPSQPEIRTASTGPDAIAMLENEPFALLLVDLNMPQMDGFRSSPSSAGASPRCAPW